MLRRGEGEIDGGEEGGMDGWREGEYKREKRTGRMLSRGEGEAGRRTGGGGEIGLNEGREGGREQRSVKPCRLILRPVI